jgi:parallel beta-helix repeat protein
MKKIVLFSLVGLLILLFGGCGLMPFTTPEVEQPSIGEPPEVPEGLEIELDPAVDLELAQSKGDTILIPWDTSIGTWDSVTRIYTLNKVVKDSIYIVEDDLTLDGAGHTITGSGGGYGVSLYGRRYVTVKNCVVSGFWNGIYLGSSSSNTLTNNTANDNNYGIYIDRSIGNEVYNNNFINNTTQAYVYGGSGNKFYLDKPDGGNYWSDWTSPNNDGDGFVDSPYVFTVGQDNLPWVLQDGWKNPVVLTQVLIGMVKELDLPTGIEKGLIALLRAALDALERGNETAAMAQLNAFIRLVEGLQHGNQLTDEQAEVLITTAQRIIDSIQ